MTQGRRLTALAMLSMLGLSACNDLNPGVAAEVGTADITMAEVDAFAVGVCALRSAQTGTEQSAKEVRAVAVSTLVLARLGHRYAEEIDGGRATEAELAAAVAEIEPQLGELSPSQRSAFLDDVRFVIEGESLINAAIDQRIEGEITEENFPVARAELLQEWSKRSDVEVDPRFGQWREGALAPATALLSVPATAAPLPGEDAVSGLAPGERCGTNLE